jgi:hypothetical protein
MNELVESNDCYLWFNLTYKATNDIELISQNVRYFVERSID